MLSSISSGESLVGFLVLGLLLFVLLRLLKGRVFSFVGLLLLFLRGEKVVIVSIGG